MKNPLSFIFGVNFFLRNVKKNSFSQNFFILLNELVGLMSWKKIIIIFVKQVFFLQSQKFFSGFVEFNEPEIFSVLYKKHIGKIFYYRFLECLCSFKFVILLLY